MDIKIIPFHEFISAYVKAYFYRPDGGNREFCKYGRELHDTMVNSAKHHDIPEVLWYTFTYLMGNLKENPTQDDMRLVTRVCLNAPNTIDSISKDLWAFLDLSAGECSPDIEFDKNTEYVTITITESF